MAAQTGDLLCVDNVSTKTLKKIGSIADGWFLVSGDGTTDGSRRMSADVTGMHYQELVSGEWVDKSFVAGSASFYIGPQMKMSESGGIPIIHNQVEGQGVLLPRWFDDTGTLTRMQDVTLGPISKVTEATPATTPMSGYVVGGNLNTEDTVQGIRRALYFQFGATTPQNGWEFSVHLGIDNLGPLLYTQIVSDIPTPNAEYMLTLDALYRVCECPAGLYFEVRSLDGISFDLLGDGTIPYVAVDVWPATHSEVVSNPPWEERTFTKDEWITDSGKIYICNTTGAQAGTFEDNAALWDVLSAYKPVTRELFIEPSNGSSYELNNWLLERLSDEGDTHFKFHLPSSFGTITEAQVVMIPDATETIQMDVQASVAAVGEAYNNDDRDIYNLQQAVTSGVLTEVDISSLLTGLAPRDYVAIDFNSDTNYIRVLGLRIAYTI